MHNYNISDKPKRYKYLQIYSITAFSPIRIRNRAHLHSSRPVYHAAMDFTMDEEAK